MIGRITDGFAAIAYRARREAPTWLAHAAIASAFTVALDPFLGDWESWRLAVWGYAFRELDRLVRQWLKLWRQCGMMLGPKPDSLWERWWRWKATTLDWAAYVNWLGSIGDVAVPALAAALVTLRWLL